MGCCNDCVFYTKRGTSMLDSFRSNISGLGGCNDIGFCMIMTDSYGNPQKVRGLDSCGNFMEKATSSNSGYSRGGGCYLTSACVEYMGKPDDCEELSLLRSFRDNYMRKDERYALLIDEYYNVAPLIVDAINTSCKQKEYYDYIYKEIQKCICFIKQGKNEEAVNEYSGMTLKLKQELLKK